MSDRAGRPPLQHDRTTRPRTTEPQLPLRSTLERTNPPHPFTHPLPRIRTRPRPRGALPASPEAMRRRRPKPIFTRELFLLLWAIRLRRRARPVTIDVLRP